MAFRPRPLARCASVAVGIFACGDARAQANDAAAAELLFNQGKQLMTQGQFAAACPKFMESQRLDPGIGTLLWLGDCYAKNGQLASAWATFHLAESLATKNSDPRASLAREEARKVEPKVSKLVIEVPSASMLDGLVIKRDGVTLGRPLWGTSIPTDAGVHKIAATALDRLPWETEISVPGQGKSLVVSVPVLDPAPRSQPAPGPRPEPAAAPVAMGEEHTGQTQRVVGIALVGVGVVGAAVGGYFGLRVNQLKADSNGHCVGNVCDHTGFQARNDALSAATVSNIAFVVAGAAIVGGVVVYLTAPSAGPRLSAGAGALGGATGGFVGGAF